MDKEPTLEDIWDRAHKAHGEAIDEAMGVFDAALKEAMRVLEEALEVYIEALEAVQGEE